MSVNNDNVNKSAIRSVAAKITSAFMGGSRSSSRSAAAATNGVKHEAKDEKKRKQKAAAKIKVTASPAKKVTSSKKVAAKKVAPKKVAAKKVTPKKVASKVSLKAGATAKSIAASVAKSVARPVAASVTKPAAKSVTASAVVSKVADVKVTSDRGSLPSSRSDKRFSSGDYVVYPAHGLGRVSSVEPVSHGDNTVDVVSIAFERDRMVVKVPVYRIEDSGLRPVSSKESMGTALKVLRSKVRTRRVMWSRRAQEYQTKIYSGDPVSIAEVVRELHRESHQGEPSFSERQIYQSALDRLASEFAVVEKIDEESAARQLVEILSQAV